METVTTPAQLAGDELFAFVLDRDLDAFLAVDAIVVWIALGLVALLLAVRLLGLGGWRRFEIDEAQFGQCQRKIA